MNIDIIYAEAIKTKHILKSTPAVIILPKRGSYG